MSKQKYTTASMRLKSDYIRLKRDPIPFIDAEPLPTNILEWHYVVTGPPDTIFSGGYYHGKLVFPPEFPFQPPSIYILTPNGRFRTKTRLCLSISDFHPDTWNPSWSVSTILTGLLSFMLEKSPTFGSVETTEYEKRELAYRSLQYIVKDKEVCELFPELVDKVKRQLKERQNMEKSAAQDLTQNTHNTTSNQFGLHTIAENLIPLIGVLLFVFIVQYVMNTVKE